MSTVDVTVGEAIITERVPAVQPGWLRSWWNGIEDAAESAADSLLYDYSRTEISGDLDKGLAVAAERVDAAKAAADRWGGFLGDPAKVEGVVRMVMITVIVLGIVYVIAVLAPMLQAVAR